MADITVQPEITIIVDNVDVTTGSTRELPSGFTTLGISALNNATDNTKMMVQDLMVWSENGLMLWYTFEEAEGTVVQDQSGNPTPNNGTIDLGAGGNTTVADAWVVERDDLE